MKDIIFALKAIGITCLVVMVMQIRMGGQTLEDHFDEFLKSSIIVDYIQEATDGGVALGKIAYEKVDNGAHFLLNKWRRHKEQHRSFLSIISRHRKSEDSEYSQSKAVTLPEAKSQNHRVE